MNNEKMIKLILKMDDQVSKGATSAANSIQKMGKTMSDVGSKMTSMFTLPIIGLGTASIKMAMDLDEAMRNIQSISKITDAEMKGLSQTFVKMSMDASMTTDSALGLAEAFYEIQGSGFAGNKAMKILEVSTKAATAGLTDTKTAAKALTQVLNTYKLGVDQAAFISDIMFETVNRGVGSYEELAASLSHVTGMAAALKVPFHEVAAALATMSRNGIDFNEGATALNMAMTSLLNPTEAMKKATKELGFVSAEAMLDSLGFAETINQLRKYAGESETKLNAMFGSVRGGRAILALTGDNFKAFTDDIKGMNDAGGAAAAAFAIQMESFAAQWKVFMNTIGAAAIEIGNILLPVLAELLEKYIIPLVKWFVDLDDATTTWILQLVALVAVAGPVISFLGSLYTGLGALVTMAGTIGIASAALFPIIGLIVAIAVAIGLLIFNWETFANAFVQLGQLIAYAWTEMLKIAATTFSQLMAMPGMFIEAIARGWQRMIEIAKTTMAQLAYIIVIGITKSIAGAGNSLSQLGQIIWTRLSGLASQMFQIGGLIVNGLINGIKSKAVDLLAYVFGLSKELTAAIKSALGISSPSKVMMDIGKNVVLGFNKGIESMGGGIGVNVPQVQGGGSSGQPSLAVAGGGGTVNNYYFTPAMGTSAQQGEEIYQYVTKRMANDVKRKGGK